MPTPVIRRAQFALWLAASTMASLAAPAASQRPDTVAQSGAQVRMWSTRMHWTAQSGQVVSWVNADTVIVAAKIIVFGKAQTNRYRVPVWELDTLQMLVRPRGVRSRLERSLIWGGTIGAAVGAVAGIAGMKRDDCGMSKIGPCSVGELGVGGGFFGLVGGLAGLAVGAVVSKLGPSDGSWISVAVPRPAG